MIKVIEKADPSQEIVAEGLFVCWGDTKEE